MSLWLQKIIAFHFEPSCKLHKLYLSPQLPERVDDHHLLLPKKSTFPHAFSRGFHGLWHVDPLLDSLIVARL